MRLMAPLFGMGMLLAFLMTSPVPAIALDLWTGSDGEKKVSLNTTLKTGGLFSRNPDDREMFPDETGGLALYRFRFDLNACFGAALNLECAYEQSGRWVSHEDSESVGSGILPSTGKASWRMTPLYEQYIEENRFAAAHEIDRGLVALHPEWGDVVIGRQAIGLGRGRLFSAVDMFSPFSTLEIDREWRRGVDALRAEYRLSATAAVEFIGVFGDSWNRSAALVRLRGYFGNTDAEILGGKRAEDEFFGMVLSSAVLDAELHTELAVFKTPEPHPEGEAFGNDHFVPKAVLGLSYTFNIGNGLTVLGEYHYSGFGAGSTDAISDLLSMPEYRERYRRGDMQILGRQAAGLQASYPLNESLNADANVLISPTDGSGLLSPSLRWDFSQTGSFTVAGYLPWGAEPEDGNIQSEYGTTALSLFWQLSFYL